METNKSGPVANRTAPNKNNDLVNSVPVRRELMAILHEAAERDQAGLQQREAGR